MLVTALIVNLLIIILEVLVLIKVKKKVDIFKYYTYLQNFLTLIVSIVFSIFSIISLINKTEVNENIKGLRYSVTCGLVSTSLIYALFISKNKDNIMNENDFNNFNPKLANLILHYIVPFLSLISFVLFERQIVLENSIWTILCAIPSILYWIVYLLLSITHLWKEPYNFSNNDGKKNSFLEVITFIIIPVSFILISIILWNVM